MDTLGNKFKHYTLQELNQFIWLWKNCSATRIINSEDDYNLAINEKKNKIKELDDLLFVD